jgi:hypothetical protein
VAALTVTLPIAKASAVGALSTTLLKAGPLKLITPSGTINPGGTTPLALALPTSDSPLNAVRLKGTPASVSVAKGIEMLVCGALKPIVIVRLRRRRLAEEYLDATIEWAEACQVQWMDLIDRLRRTYSAVLSTEDQERNPLVIDEARLKTAHARLALESHVAAHNC